MTICDDTTDQIVPVHEAGHAVAAAALSDSHYVRAWIEPPGGEAHGYTEFLKAGTATASGEN